MIRYQYTGRIMGRFTREARDRMTGKLCIIKGPFSSSPFEQRFSHEARVLSELSVTGVVGLRQCLRLSGRCWLVLEHLPGQSLERELDHGVVSYGAVKPDRAGSLIARIARIVHLCHRQGWVHCDICPANIQIQGSQVWLLDFGAALAKGGLYPWCRQVRPGWSSPALKAGQGLVSEADDVYSLLWLAVVLLSHQRPLSLSECACRRNYRQLQRPRYLSRRQWQFLRRGLEHPGQIAVQDLADQALGW